MRYRLFFFPSGLLILCIVSFSAICHANTTRSQESIKQNIGEQSSSLGSAGQATALLQIISDFPNRTEYQISYTTNGEIVVFGCDFSKDVLARLHNKPDGHGSAETWDGDIPFRLRAAQNSESLNDTPTGKKLGSFSNF